MIMIKVIWYDDIGDIYDKHRINRLGDHYSLYEDLERQTDKLKTYAGHFPVVELDATYYAIQPERNILKWIKRNA